MPIDVWPIDASAGSPSYSGQDLRFGTVVPFLTGNGASLGVRSGVRPSGSGSDMQVLAQTSPNMSVRVTSGSIVVQGAISASQGAYTWTNDSTITRTIAAAHATLARIDLVVVRIRDASVDTSGGRDGDVIVITGTAGGGVPSLPTDATYITLAQVAVGAAVSSIVGGNITDKRPFTAALGGVIPFPSTARPAANSVPAGQSGYETDTKRWMWSDGSTWRLTAGQLLYSKRDVTTTFFSNQPTGFVTAFTSPSISLPNTGVGQAYEIEWTIPATNGAFSNGRFNSEVFFATNGGGFTGYGKSSPTSTNAIDTWEMQGRETFKAGNGDTTLQVQIQVIGVGGNFDCIASGTNPMILRVKSTGLLATEVV